MVSFCTRVECKQDIPFCSLMKARILLDAYFTISPSKVAVITNAPAPLEIIYEDRNPDPLWVTAVKIASYILLAPLALLSLFVKCALYCVPLHAYAPRITSDHFVQATITAKPNEEKPEEPSIHPEVQTAIAENDKPALDLWQMKEKFERYFPASCAKEAAKNGSPLSKQQKAYLKSHIAIKAQLVEALLPKDHQARKHCIETELVFVRHVALNALFDLNEPKSVQGYAVLKAYYQDVMECYEAGFKASGYEPAAYASLARNEIKALLNDMADTYWTAGYSSFLQRYDELEDDTRTLPKLLETRDIILCVCGMHWGAKNYAEKHAAAFLNRLPQILE